MSINLQGHLRSNLLLTVFFAALLCSCNSKGPENGHIGELAKTIDTTPRPLLKEEYIRQRLSANHNLLLNTKGDLNSFSKYVSRLDNHDVASIPFMLDYIKTCLPSNNIGLQDSAFLIFSEKFFSVANILTDNLDSVYRGVLVDIEKDSQAVAAKNFKGNLAQCGLGVFSTEGIYYADVQFDYFYNNFKGRVSDATTAFLELRKDEMLQGFSEDAAMLISFEDLYKRVKNWENFLNTYPNSLHQQEANNFYATYLETLMTGMDNSRVFDLETNTLLPEMKLLYEKIISEKPGSKTSKIISGYYELLVRENFKQSSQIDSFLNQNQLNTMLAVEPQNR